MAGTFGAPSPGLAATLSHPMGDGASLGRETQGEVVLVSRLRVALEKLNPMLPSEAIAAAIDGLTRDRSAMLPEQANREVYRLLKEGIPVSVADTDSTPRPQSQFQPHNPTRPAATLSRSHGRGTWARRTDNCPRPRD